MTGAEGPEQSAQQGSPAEAAAPRKSAWRLWSGMYDRVLGWSRHRRAPAILSGLSFAESSFFPIPPDVMLAPMCLAQPLRGWRFASLCTLSSVAGGLLGYIIGRWAFHWIEPWLSASHYNEVFQRAVQSFDSWGFWFVLLAGFTPIPYKIFTISAGVVSMPLAPFIAGSLIGRGSRFFLVAGLIRLMGERAAERLRDWVDLAGWVVLGLAVLAYVAWKIVGAGT